MLRAQIISDGANGKPSFDDATQTVFESIYSYKFAHADSLIKQYKQKNPHSAWGSFLGVNYYWWLIMSGEKTPAVLKVFADEINTILRKTEVKKKKYTNEEIYLVANAYIFKSRLNLLEGDYIKGLVSINKCIDFIELMLGKEEKYEAFLLQAALFNYFIDYARKEKPITKPYLISMPEGSMEKGIRQFEHGTKSKDNFIQVESTYILGKIYQEVELRYAKAETFTATLVKKYPNNVLCHFNYYDCLMNQGKKEEAQKELIAINRLSKSVPNLTKHQQVFFINEAMRVSQEYYKKQAKKN